ncbi:MAG: FAD-binding protein, partial [Anaerolineales bacterium]
MREETITTNGQTLPITRVHTLIIGSGAAGLNAAVQLKANGIDDVLIVSEGLHMGTSINTGSDKQTYYKLSLCGMDADAPEVMAETYYEGGSMHGDLALVEASLSARAFIHLVNLGVPFPRDAYGQFVGYKTDHDPRQRATSIGPYTSREMCKALIRQVQALGIPVREGRNIIELLTVEDTEDGTQRMTGAVALDNHQKMEAYTAENVIFAVGGPGGLYKTSVYPAVHTGAIGLALMAGAKAQSLPESQYGMASTKFRWNVSGTYMQVIPRFISTAADGASDPVEFMRPYFQSIGEMNSMVFLKGYQWPFDWRKVRGGSSIVDILVYIETVLKGRRVFMDFHTNPQDFDFNSLSEEALTYLTKSEALLDSPIARLEKMNPGAIALYMDHDIDIRSEPLEIAVCAQHNNGGLAGNAWWESVNVKHMFVLGEVNGSHGVYRPGGAALNSGQVGGFRAAEFIANRYQDFTLSDASAVHAIAQCHAELLQWISASESAHNPTWQEDRAEFQNRMSRAGAHIRSLEALRVAVPEAWAQWKRLQKSGDPANIGESLRNRQLCFAHAVYLEALLFSLEQGTGSRGSSIALDPKGNLFHESLDAIWRIVEE